MSYEYKIHSINQGFCRINYVAIDEDEEFHYCLQYDGVKITFYICSEQFEPLVECCESTQEIADRSQLFEKPDGDFELEIKVRAWIDNE